MNQANTARAREHRHAARGKTALRIFALLFGLLVAAPAFALNAIWNTATDVPVTASGYTASGTVTFTLNFAPSAGTNLTVVSNTAAGFITGTFSNLTRGQVVTLTYGGVNYRFVANYNGGTGNDLVLQWANARSVAWGYNAYGQLGDNTTTDRLIPVNVLSTGALAGKTVIAQAAGALHSVALCSDGTVAAWGYNLEGELGNNSTTSSSVPVAVNTVGVLAGKTVIAVAAGYKHNLALCSDGTLAAWGRGDQGQLGNGTTANSTVPVAVNTAAVLAGKTVIAIATGYKHSLALCSDGTLAAWGYNVNGQLGNNSTTNSSVPVAVNTASGVSALFGKTVIAVAAGGYHNLALCSDGTLASWGFGLRGQLGNGSIPDRWVPVAVNTAGVLSGKTVVAMAVGLYHSVALSSDGTVAAWGYNTDGELGDNSTNNSVVPVAVNAAGVLSGKTVVAVAGGEGHSLALCADGTLAAWGRNLNGQLGNNSTANSPVPVAVSGSLLASGERYAAVIGGCYASHDFASIVAPVTPGVIASAVTGITLTSATLNGTVNPNGNASTAYFEYGLTTSYGTTASVTLSPNNGTAAQNVSASLTGLTSGTLYHYRLTGTNSAGTASTSDGTFATISTNANLANLALSASALSPAFASGTTSYSAIASGTSVINVTPIAADGTATIKVNGVTVASGSASSPVSVASGSATITVVVTAQDGVTTKTYAATVTKAPLTWTYNAASEVPVTGGIFTTDGAATLALNFAPPAGTNLMVVKNTGLGFVNGTFSNLAQGQAVTLSYGGVNYQFVASYYGGTGNDLVLQWANVRPVAWGQNTYGQLGDNSVTNRFLPVNVLSTGALSGKTVIAVAAGNAHSLALCSDGTLAAWGSNSAGQLGNNSTTNSSVPVAVNTAGVLAGKTVVAMAVGGSHSLALCLDGTLAAWGYNTSGQLGNNSTANSIVPVAVNKASGVSALFGKTVVAVAAGGAHSLALCSDGTVAAWGYNANGQLGNNTVGDSPVAVAVNMAGALAGKTVIAVAAGCYHSLALCSDGTVAAWGYNYHGELGDGTALTTNPYGKLAPVAVNATGVLTGKTVVAVTAGYYHSLVLCTDGTLAAWGDNTYGQLGNNSTTQSNVPVPVNTSGVLVGKTVVAVAAGQYHSNALCSDGTRAAWGSNAYGQIGNNSTTTSVPVAVSGSPLAAGERHAAVVSGSGASYNVGLIASPEYPGVLPLAITSLLSFGVTLNCTVNPNGNATTAYFEYGLTTGYGSISSVALSPANGTTAQNVSASLTGLAPATLYHYRLTATNNIGVASTSDGTFTTMSTNADLASLVVSGSTLSPVFASGTMSYTASAVGTSVTNVTPTVADSTATVQVNGAMVASGNASGPVSVASGSAVFTIVVTAQDGTTTKTYTVTAAKVPMTWTYSTASEAPAAGSIFTADGAATFALNFAPPAGTNLMVVKNTGATFINGTFSNLAQGQAVLLSYGGIKYRFVANYYGGTGNDLVLQWANVRPVAWGYNTYGQIGDNTTTNGLVPVNVLTSGVLSGKTVIAQAAGYQHTLALCSDGTAAAWGYNYEGELGDGTTTTASPYGKLAPVAVNTAGVLAGKRVVAVAGYNHSLALCSDGTVAAWGYNLLGQLGNNTTDNSSLPVAVSTSGVLAGKTVVAVAAGIYHSLALCSDGTLAAWGDNINGQLGNNSSNSSNVPVAVSMSGVLAGKTVIAVAAGANRNLVLCSDGTLATWGGDSSVPVAVTMSGVLAGKTVVAVAAGASHRLALCSDGTVAAWGANDRGQLGNNSNVNSTVPVAVSLSGVLAGKTVVAVAAGIQHSLALCSDGTMAAWGDNIYHQLGNDAFNGSLVPVVVSSSPLAAGERYAATFGGPAAYHSLGLIASPPAPPVVITLAFTNLTISGVTLNGTVNPGGNAATASFEYGTGLSYGGTASVALSPNNGTTAQNVSASLTGLAPETLYHYRLTATNIDGTVSTGDGTFTTQLSPLESWRQQWFGNSANSGPGTDDADPNGNGIPNLLEYALGGDPLGSATDGGLLPQAATGAANTLQIAFTRYLDRNDLTLTVKAADSLLGPWADLAQSAQGGAFVILQPGATAPETGAGNTRTVTVTDIYQVSDLAHPRRFIKLEVAR